MVTEQLKTPIRKPRKRPATPLLRKNSESTDLLLTSPRHMGNQLIEDRASTKAKRNTSSKRLDTD